MTARPLHVVNPLRLTDPGDLDGDGLVGEVDGTGLDPLFPGDVGQLSLNARAALVTLLKRRYVSAETHPKEWRVVLEEETTLRSRLNDLFLDLIVDRDYEVAYKKQTTTETGGRFPTLLHDAEYSREETILLVYLRGKARAAAVAGEDAPFVDRADLLTEIAHYRPPSATNEVRDEKAAKNAVESLVKSAILLKTAESDRYRVSKIIEVVMPVHRVQELAAWLRAQNGTGPAPTGASDPGSLDALDGPDGRDAADGFDEQEGA